MATTTVIAARAITAFGATRDFEAIKACGATKDAVVALIRAAGDAAATAAETAFMTQRGRAGIHSGTASLH
jgi:hypothetical protein